MLVSHDPESASVADRIVRVRDGRVSEEAAIADGGDEAIVVGRGGWLRLSEELLRRTGIHSHAAARLHEHGILLQAAPGAAAAVVAEEDAAAGPAVTGEIVAEVDGLSRTYGEGAAAATALAELDAAFAGGRLTAVTGPSGSGKTTLLHLLAGLDLPSRGEVRVLGETLSGLDRDARARFRAEHVGLVSQETGLVPFLTAAENIELGLSLRGVEAEEAGARAVEALAAVDLAGAAGRQVADLSSGQRERVAVARAVAGRPALLLADEPTARLDQANALAVARLLARPRARDGRRSRVRDPRPAPDRARRRPHRPRVPPPRSGGSAPSWPRRLAGSRSRAASWRRRRPSRGRRRGRPSGTRSPPRTAAASRGRSRRRS